MIRFPLDVKVGARRVEHESGPPNGEVWIIAARYLARCVRAGKAQGVFTDFPYAMCSRCAWIRLVEVGIVHHIRKTKIVGPDIFRALDGEYNRERVCTAVRGAIPRKG